MPVGQSARRQVDITAGRENTIEGEEASQAAQGAAGVNTRSWCHNAALYYWRGMQGGCCKGVAAR